MKTNANDNANGKINQLFGKVKEIAGKLIKSPGLKAEGQVEILKGKAQEKISKIKKLLGK